MVAGLEDIIEEVNAISSPCTRRPDIKACKSVCNYNFHRRRPLIISNIFYNYTFPIVLTSLVYEIDFNYKCKLAYKYNVQECLRYFLKVDF